MEAAAAQGRRYIVGATYSASGQCTQVVVLLHTAATPQEQLQAYVHARQAAQLAAAMAGDSTGHIASRSRGSKAVGSGRGGVGVRWSGGPLEAAGEWVR